jgi:hypothetical protein
LVLDEPRDNDESYEVEGVRFLLSKPTVLSIQRDKAIVAIDFAEDARGNGFRVFLREAQN